ncbi:MAG: putative fumarylacetoacetate hydrolase family protein, partial [Halothiobacillaceae bacterium]
QQLNDREIAGAPLDLDRVAAPLPRAYQWLDASAYLSHVERVRRSRGAEMPPSFYDDPLMYQGGSDTLLGAHQPIEAADASWGIDFEGEVAIITDDVPSGVTVANASRHIKLVLLVNDISLRNLAPAELAKGFGFLHAKPPTAFSPVAVTVDELGEFNFAELIHHAATTRPLGAGTIIGSGTVSNHDRARGCACLIEQRILEKLDTGTATTPFLRHGDRVRIEMLDNHGQTIFGAIDQPVKITGEIP